MELQNANGNNGTSGSNRRDLSNRLIVAILLCHAPISFDFIGGFSVWFRLRMAPRMHSHPRSRACQAARYSENAANPFQSVVAPD